MTVFLGESGFVELIRAGVVDNETYSLAPGDVSVAKDRFSFTYPTGMLITGDLVQFKATDGGLLDFVDASGWIDNTIHEDGAWYVNVDDVGGIRLYHYFGDAVNGEQQGRVSLQQPTRTIPLEVGVDQSTGRCLAQCTDYEFSNTREAADVTALTDEFRNQYSGIISGSGSLNCFFSYRQEMCDGTNQPTEKAAYLHQLVLRQTLGSKFRAKLFVIRPEVGAGDAANDQVWFEFDALITNSAISLEPTSLIRSRIQFVTTGPIRMKIATAEGFYLLQENNGFLLLNQDVASRLERDTV